MLLVGMLLAVPTVTTLYYPEDARYVSAFLIPSIVSVVIGFLVCSIPQMNDEKTAEWQSPLQKGSSPVLFAWCFAFLVGAVPFILGKQLPPLHALFESVSGWTTTGMTLVNSDTLPRIFLFHRAFMQYCGGLGFVIVIAMLVQQKQSMNLYNAEGHPDGLLPNIKRTARAIFLLYMGSLILGTVSLSVFGMPVFDSICHTMSALSTAGFSTRSASIGAYASVPIEIVTIILMLIGATNFAILLLIAKRKFRQLVRVSEFQFMVGLVVLFSILIAFSLMHQTGNGFGRSLLDATFGVVTTFSTTGYSTADYAHAWPQFAIGMLVILMIVGGGVGSTAGGIKLLRSYLLIKITGENLRKRVSPARRVSVPTYYRVQGKTIIDEGLVQDTLGFFMSYLGVLAIGTLLLTLTEDCTLFDAFFEFASAFGTVGLSNGLTSVQSSAGTLWIQMMGMLLGRLEIFIVFLGIHSSLAKGFKDFSKMCEPVASKTP